MRGWAEHQAGAGPRRPPRQPPTSKARVPPAWFACACVLNGSDGLLYRRIDRNARIHREDGSASPASPTVVSLDEAREGMILLLLFCDLQWHNPGTTGARRLTVAPRCPPESLR